MEKHLQVWAHVPEKLDAEHVSTKSEELNTIEIVKLLLCFASLLYCAEIIFEFFTIAENV